MIHLEGNHFSEIIAEWMLPQYCHIHNSTNLQTFSQPCKTNHCIAKLYHLPISKVIEALCWYMLVMNTQQLPVACVTAFKLLSELVTPENHHIGMSQRLTLPLATSPVTQHNKQDF